MSLQTNIFIRVKVIAKCELVTGYAIKLEHIDVPITFSTYSCHITCHI